MAEREWDMRSAIEQIESCGFECDAGPLSSSAAWVWLRKSASGPRFRIGEQVPYNLKAEVAGFTLVKTVPLTIVGIRMTSTSDGTVWLYDLSNDPPGAWHYGSGVTAANVREDKILDALAKAETSNA